MISDFCIKRPVFAAVLSMLLIVLGLASLLRLSVRELPDVDSAVVTVNTTYTGAAPEIVDTDITEVIEGAVAGVAGVKTIRSSSRRGRGWTSIEFEPGRNIDEAANDVRDAVARVRVDLPDEVDEPQITKSDDDDDPVIRVSVTSDRMRPAEITDYVERFVSRSPVDPGGRLPGGDLRRAPLRDPGLAGPAGDGGAPAHRRRRRGGAPAQQRRAARRRAEVDDATVHRARPEPAGRGRAVREHHDRAHRRLPDPACRHRAHRARRRGRRIHRPLRWSRGSRSRRHTPVAGEHDRDLQSRPRAGRADAADPAGGHGDQNQLRRRGFHQGVDQRGGAGARHRSRAGGARDLRVSGLGAGDRGAGGDDSGRGDRRVHRHLCVRLLDQRAHTARADPRDRHRGRRRHRRAGKHPAADRAGGVAVGRRACSAPAR